MCCKRNWTQYNQDLVNRGSITFLIDPKVLNSCKNKGKRTGRGRPILFPLELIHILLLTKIHYRLTYRSLEGFSKSIFSLLGHNILLPTYSLICKKASEVHQQIPNLPMAKSHIVILDASGLKVLGEGEWKRKIHGRGRPRKWVKLHIAIDRDTQDILANITTPSNIADITQAEPLLNTIKGKLKKVLADGAYDGARDMFSKRGIQGLVPPPRNAKYRNTDKERDRAILEILGLGGDERARSIWGKLTGYNYRVLVETAFSRMKRLFGERLFSKKFDKQKIENMLRCELLNKFNALSR